MMLIISYDISDDKLRTKFSKTLMKQGAIRLQYSVYEVNNSKRVLDNLKIRLDKFYGPRFSGGDSVLIFDVDESKTIKYGCAIHRDRDIVYF